MAALSAAAAFRATAQSTAAPRVAWISTERRNPASPTLRAFQEGMRDLGYVEGRNVTVEPWWSEGSAERLERLVAEVAGTKPDVIVAQGGGVLGQLIRAGAKPPIVFSVSADPVEAKFVESFARPGVNRTGISLFTLALVGKRMELVKEVLPAARRVAILANQQHPGEHLEREAATKAAAKLGMTIRYFPVNTEAELEKALADIAKNRDDAIIAFADGFTMGFAPQIATFATKHRIPAVDGWAPFARAGNLLIYGPVLEDVYRRLASYVDKILKGAKPAELPVELPTKVELVVNLKAAKALGLVIPPSLLARADEVIR